MSVIIEIGKDALGINGYQHAAKEQRDYHATKPTEIVSGIASGTVQVIVPFSYQQIERLFYGDAEKEPKLRYAVLSMLTDVLGVSAVLWLAGQNPQESVPIAVGGKVIYNAAASAVPRVVESAKARFRPQRSA